MWTVIALTSIGGLVNHLIVNERALIPPKRIKDGGWSAGFVGDVLLGVVAGAITWLSLRVDLPRDKELVSAAVAAIAFPSFFEAIVGPGIARERSRAFADELRRQSGT